MLGACVRMYVCITYMNVCLTASKCICFVCCTNVCYYGCGFECYKRKKEIDTLCILGKLVERENVCLCERKKRRYESKKDEKIGREKNKKA